MRAAVKMTLGLEKRGVYNAESAKAFSFQKHLRQNP